MARNCKVKALFRRCSAFIARIPRFVGDLTKSNPVSRSGWLFMLALCVFSTFFVELRLATKSGILLGSNTDAVSTHYPFRDFIHTCIKHGVFPLWNPHIFNGLPMQTGLRPVLNPWLLLTYLSPNIETEMRWAVFTHLFWTHLGALLWLRTWNFSPLACWFGSLVVTFTGFQLGHLYAGHYDILSTLAWVPWLLWSHRLALTRAGTGWTGLAVGLFLVLMSCGHYHLIYLSLWYLMAEFVITTAGGRWGATSAWNFGKVWAGPRPDTERPGWHLFRGLLRIGVIGIAVGGLNCWQLLPTLETVANSVRGQSSYEDAIQFGSPPQAWLTMLVPHLFQGSVEIVPWCGWPVWEGQAFMGIISLLLVMYGLLQSPSSQWRCHLLIAILAHWLALGQFGGLFKLYYHLDPLVGIFRVPSRFLWPATLATAWLAANGAQALFDHKFTWKPATRRFFSVLLTLAVCVWLFIFYQNGYAGWWQSFLAGVAVYDESKQGIPADFSTLLALTWTRYSSSVFWLASFVYVMVRVPQRFKLRILCALMLIELGQFSRTYQHLAPADSLDLSPEVLEFVRDHATSDRYSSEPGLGWQNHFAAYGLSEVNGYDNIMGIDYARQVLRSIGLPPGTLITVYSYPHPCFLHSIQSCKNYVSTVNYVKKNTPDTHLYVGTAMIHADNSALYFYQDPEAVRRAYFVPGVRAMDKPGQGMAELAEHWERTKINANVTKQTRDTIQAEAQKLGFKLGEAKTPPLPSDSSVGRAWVDPNRVVIECNNRVPGMLILTDAPWPGWHAKVDGRETPIFASECDLHRSVILPPGKHIVEFSYWPDRLTIGIDLSQKCLAALAGIFCLGWVISRLHGRSLSKSQPKTKETE